MTDLKTAAQQALKVMESAEVDPHSSDAVYKAITALRAALAKQVSNPEPVAWYHVPYPGNGISPVVSMYQQHEPSLYGAVVPLYTAPPQRKPLSGLEVERLLEQVIGSLPAARRLVRAIERAHGIGEKE